jgi:O-antigen ligase
VNDERLIVSDMSSVRGAEGGWFSSLLLVVVFCFFWIGIAPFPDPNASELLTAYGMSSNLMNQLIVIALAALVLLVLANHPARWLVLRSYGLLAVIFCWLLFTAAFSDAPATALRRIVYAMLVCLCASSALLLPRDSDQFGKLIGTCVLTAVLLSLLGVLVFPQLAIHQGSDALEQQLAGAWRGHFGHKNVAAAAMVFAVFFGIFFMKTRSFWWGALIVCCSTVFLLNAGGKTSAAMLPAILVASWFFERIGSFRIVFLVSCLALMNYVLLSAAISREAQDLLISFGIDPTFTDRASVWKLALGAIAERPWVGHGFQTFWQMDALVYSEEADSTWAVTAANAHNGYLDQAINGGFPLLLLIMIWLVWLPCRHAGLAFRRAEHPELTRLFVRCWLFMLFLACLESPFFDNHGPVWFTMLIAVFGLRMLAYGNLKTTGYPEALTRTQLAS